MRQQERILVFIPMYNCQDQIPRVLKQLQQPEIAELIHGVVCVDNRSPDNTRSAAEAGLERVPVGDKWLMHNDDNYGLGGSHKVAIDLALREGFDYMIVLHGDDQGAIIDIEPHVRNGTHRAVDFLLGARFMKGSRLVGYSSTRIFLNRALNLVYSILLLRPVYDVGSGLNLFRISSFENGFERRFADDLTFNLYLLFGIINEKRTLSFFPLSWREEDQVSNARMARIARQVAILLLKRVLKFRSFFTDEHRDIPRDAYPSTEVRRWREA